MTSGCSARRRPVSNLSWLRSANRSCTPMPSCFDTGAPEWVVGHQRAHERGNPGGDAGRDGPGPAVVHGDPASGQHPVVIQHTSRDPHPLPLGLVLAEPAPPGADQDPRSRPGPPLS